MSQQHATEQHLHHLSEMRNILNAMKNLAFMESRKLFRLLKSQRQMVFNLERVATDFLNFHPYTETVNESLHNIYLLIGSERGFCGNFNEKLGQAFTQKYPLDNDPIDTIIVVGNKLSKHLKDDSRVARFIDGASFEEEIETVLNTIVSVVNELQQQYSYITLTVVYHGEQSDQINIQKLLPPFQVTPETLDFTHAPLMNLSTEAFFADLSEHYLLAVLHEISYTSLMIENNWRAQHLDGAVNRLDKNTETLQQKCRMLRQEAITEEIEVILLSAESMLQINRNSS